jgi:hypothetical protein
MTNTLSSIHHRAPHKHIALACVEITFLDMCAREMHTSGDDVMAKRKKHLSQRAPKVLYQFGESRAPIYWTPAESETRVSIALDTFNLCLKRWVGGRAARKMFS